jgi:hypothetical protein
MKLQIQSYLIGVLNNHKRIIGSMKDNGYSKVSIQSHENYTNELRDLYDFISILPDEQISDTYKEINRLRNILARIEIDSDTETLRRRNLQRKVTELEESCEIMCEVEKNNHTTIKELESANIRYRGQLLENDKKIIQLEEVNSGVWEENRRIKLLNKQSFRKIKILKNKLKSKLKGDC